jgi:hypothetical protein
MTAIVAPTCTVRKANRSIIDLSNGSLDRVNDKHTVENCDGEPFIR